MKRVKSAVLRVTLFAMAFAVNAETHPATDPVPTASVITSADAQPPVETKPVAQVVKYVRNITSPNGFGESTTINDAIFYAKSGDVNAETGDKLEYAIVISTPAADLQDVSIQDFIPAYTEYVPGSTLLNNVAIADIDGKSPLQESMLVNDADSALHSGIIKAGASAIVLFRVRVNLMLDVSGHP